MKQAMIGDVVLFNGTGRVYKIESICDVIYYSLDCEKNGRKYYATISENELAETEEEKRS